ncbi:MAG TPA: hypothetical protein VGF69_05485 [Thermoanaerobaculia bacterium]|jgi:hypothetical protein
MRTFIATLLSLILTTAALAADTMPDPSRELQFKLASAKVTKFDRPLQSRQGKYEMALVLRLEASKAAWMSLPPASATFLYVGKHELRPFETQTDGDRVILVFHDPRWQELQGGEPMVLTTDHGDPILYPENYAGYPRFDPRTIE